MTRYEYKVVPAPRKGLKAKGIKGHEARFSNSLEALINETAAEGWSYMRAETLPSEERSGFRSGSTVYRNVLVFRREAGVEEQAAEADVAPALIEDLSSEPQMAEPEVAAPAPIHQPYDEPSVSREGFSEAYDDQPLLREEPAIEETQR